MLTPLLLFLLFLKNAGPRRADKRDGKRQRNGCQKQLSRRACFLVLFVLVDILGFSIVLPLMPYLTTSFDLSPTSVGLLQVFLHLCTINVVIVLVLSLIHFSLYYFQIISSIFNHTWWFSRQMHWRSSWLCLSLDPFRTRSGGNLVAVMRLWHLCTGEYINTIFLKLTESSGICIQFGCRCRSSFWPMLSQSSGSFFLGFSMAFLVEIFTRTSVCCRSSIVLVFNKSSLALPSRSSVYLRR